MTDQIARLRALATAAKADLDATRASGMQSYYSLTGNDLIAALSPDVVLALLSRLEAVERVIGEIELACNREFRRSSDSDAFITELRKLIGEK